MSLIHEILSIINIVLTPMGLKRKTIGRFGRFSIDFAITNLI